MKFGPKIVYECPTCKQKVKTLSLLSSNNLKTKKYTDGREKGPMSERHPKITKCPNCGAFFWLKDMVYNGFKHHFEKQISKVFETELIEYPEENEDQPWIPNIDINEVRTAIEQGVFSTRDEEIYLRLRYWYLVNNRQLNNETMFRSSDEQQFWEANIQRLISILDQKREDARCIIAEMQRNLGHFEMCLQTLKTISDKNHQPLREKLSQECNKQNRWVVPF